MPDMYLIVGLGNPGRQYRGNRHNVGFRCLDVLAEAHGLSFGRYLHQAITADGTIAGRRVLLAKPQTFMNLSGISVAAMIRFYKIPLERLLVIGDDLDLPTGTLRMRKKGGSGGHRGLQDIIDRLGSEEFPRLRIGIGRPPGRMDAADYVLQDFTADELQIIDVALRRAADAVECWLTDGIELAMSRYNGPAA